MLTWLFAAAGTPLLELLPLGLLPPPWLPPLLPEDPVPWELGAGFVFEAEGQGVVVAFL